MFVLGAVFWVVGLAIAVVAAICVYATPALFHLCVYLQWHAVQIVQDLTHKRPSHGLLILISLVPWGGVGSLAGALLLGSWLGIGVVLVCGVVGALWGAAVGHQVALRTLMIEMRRPGFLSHQTPGATFRFPREGSDTQGEQEGVFLGRRGWPQ